MTLRRVVTTLVALLAITALVRAEVRIIDQGHKLAHDDHIATAASREVTALLASQTANRVKNVAIWCDRFVVLEGVIVKYVLGVPGAPPLPLKPLTPKACSAIEHGTARSTRPN